MIHKGCTSKNSFSIPYPKEDIEVLYITYSQKRREHKKVVFEKTLDDCVFEGGYLVVQLSQENTLLLQSNTEVEIQIRARLKNGEAVKSNIIKTTTDEVLKDGVI